MARLVALLVVLAIVFSVDAWSFRDLKNTLSRSGERSKRATNCNDAYRESQGPRYVQCLGYLSDNELSDDQLDTFCNGHCVPILGRVFHDIFIYCNEQDLANISIFLNLICTKNSFGGYCYSALMKIDDDNFPSYFNSCLATSFTGSCTDACKNVAEYIETKLGCCYESVVQNAKFFGIPPEFNYSPTFFSTCGAKAIEPACPIMSPTVHPTRTRSSIRPTRTRSSIHPTRTSGPIRPTRTRFGPGPTPK